MPSMKPPNQGGLSPLNPMKPMESIKPQLIPQKDLPHRDLSAIPSPPSKLAPQDQHQGSGLSIKETPFKPEGIHLCISEIKPGEDSGSHIHSCAHIIKPGENDFPEIYACVAKIEGKDDLAKLLKETMKAPQDKEKQLPKGTQNKLENLFNNDKFMDKLNGFLNDLRPPSNIPPDIYQCTATIEPGEDLGPEIYQCTSIIEPGEDLGPEIYQCTFNIEPGQNPFHDFDLPGDVQQGLEQLLDQLQPLPFNTRLI